MITTIQVMGIVFSLVMAYLSFLYYKRREIRGIELFYWTLLWAMFVYILFFPDNISPVLQFFQIARIMDFFMIIAFMILFGLAFHNYIVYKRILGKVEEVVRKSALGDLKKK